MNYKMEARPCAKNSPVPKWQIADCRDTLDYSVTHVF